MAPDEAFPSEASGGRRDGDVSKPRKKSSWWGETERVMLPVAIFPKVTVGLTAARAFGALAMRADNKSGLVDSTYEQIAEDAGMSRRQAADGVATLIRLGWVEQVRRGNSRVSSKYRMRAVAEAPLTETDSAETRTVKGVKIRTVNSAETRTVQADGQCGSSPQTVRKSAPPLVSPLVSKDSFAHSSEGVSAEESGNGLFVVPRSVKPNSYTFEFEQFWLAYPRRDGSRGSKAGAFANWQKALKLVSVETLMAAVDGYARSKKVTEGFAMDAKRWLGKSEQGWEEFTSTVDERPPVTFESLAAAADAKRAADLIRAPYTDPSQHPSDPTPRGAWIKARRLEWIEAHEREIRAALTRRAS